MGDWVPRRLALLASLGVAHAFVPTYAAGNLPLYSFVWTSPADPMSTKGLGQGLAYAVDATFCDRILPQFSERGAVFQFVDCDLLRAALNRAFNTWSDNHPTLSFLDVSKQCEEEHGGARGCPRAEFVIQAGGTDGPATVGGGDERAAVVQLHVDWELARTAQPITLHALCSFQLLLPSRPSPADRPRVAAAEPFWSRTLDVRFPTRRHVLLDTAVLVP